MQVIFIFLRKKLIFASFFCTASIRSWSLDQPLAPGVFSSRPCGKNPNIVWGFGALNTHLLVVSVQQIYQSQVHVHFHYKIISMQVLLGMLTFIPVFIVLNSIIGILTNFFRYYRIRSPLSLAKSRMKSINGLKIFN